MHNISILPSLVIIVFSATISNAAAPTEPEGTAGTAPTKPAPVSEGDRPYTPTKLEWLRLELQADKVDPLPDVRLSYNTLPNVKDTIFLAINYTENASRERVQPIAEVERRNVLARAKQRGWDWVKVQTSVRGSDFFFKPDGKIESEFPREWFSGTDREHWDRNAMCGKPPPKLALSEWINGEVSPDERKGKIVVVDFWATWCGPCLKEMPLLNDLHHKYREKGLHVIGVCGSEDGQDRMAEVVKKLNVEYAVARDQTRESEAAWAMTIRSPVSGSVARSLSTKWASTKTATGFATFEVPNAFSSAWPRNSGKRIRDEHF